MIGESDPRLIIDNAMASSGWNGSYNFPSIKQRVIFINDFQTRWALNGLPRYMPLCLPFTVGDYRIRVGHPNERI